MSPASLLGGLNHANLVRQHNSLDAVVPVELLQDL